MYKICVISLYFGELPNYSNLWLESCRRNNSIDFLLVTDQDVNELPQNVKKLKMDLNTIKQRLEHKLGMDVCLEKPYKCCDYKPFYGFIFEEELRGYDFWGYCDMDVIWGNIRMFITDDILSEYDKIYPLGHLSLYRNTYECNRYFMLPGSQRGNYKDVISTHRICVFDEIYGINKIFEYNKLPIYMKRDCADINFRKRRLTLVGPSVKNYSVQAFFMKNGDCFRVYEAHGDLYYDEFCYIHLQKRRYKKTIEPCNCFFITADQFIPISEKVDKELIQKVNPYKGKIYEFLEEVFFDFSFRCKRKTNNLFIK